MTRKKYSKKKKRDRPKTSSTTPPLPPQPPQPINDVDGEGKSKDWWKIGRRIATVIFLLAALISIYEFFFVKRPNLRFIFQHMANGIDLSYGKNTTAIFITCELKNKGEEPYYPKIFKLDIIYDGETISTRSQPVPDNFTSATNDSALIEIGNAAQKDLLKLKKLNPLDNYEGDLYFVADISSYIIQNANKLTYQITCIDEDDNEKIFKYTPKKSDIAKLNKYFPKEDIKVVPRLK